MHSKMSQHRLYFQCNFNKHMGIRQIHQFKAYRLNTDPFPIEKISPLRMEFIKFLAGQWDQYFYSRINGTVPVLKIDKHSQKMLIDTQKKGSYRDSVLQKRQIHSEGSVTVKELESFLRTLSLWDLLVLKQYCCVFQQVL